MTVVDVTQEDRDAAANLIEHKCLPGDLTPTNIRLGNLDDGFAVQAFARHRLARPAPDGEVVAYLHRGPHEGEIAIYTKIDRTLTTGQNPWSVEPLYTHPPRNDAVVEALRAKVTQLQEALVQHNERLRSAASIARRDGRETNWLTFRGAVTYTLAEYRELVTECLSALKQGEA